MPKCQLCTIPLKSDEQIRCFDCLGAESKMKDRCFICFKKFFNTFIDWKKKGNCCSKCDAKAEIAVERLRAEQREVDRLKRYSFWLIKTGNDNTDLTYKLFCRLDAVSYKIMSDKGRSARTGIENYNVID